VKIFVLNTIINKVSTFCRCITHISSIIDINRFALLTFIIPPIMGGQDWYIYKYWFKMLKRWKFPPLIKARASSTNCTMGNLTWSRHTTYYIQSMLNLTRFISFYYTNPWPVRELYVCDAIMKKLGSSCYDQQCFYWLIMS
jgi:hypothetical protein